MRGRHPKFVGNLTEQVTELLLRRIESGIWKPGWSLPSELTLSEELNVSVGTVSKALRKLQERGLVIRERGRGSRISLYSDSITQKRLTNFFDSSEQPTTGTVVSREFQCISTCGDWLVLEGRNQEDFLSIHSVREMDGVRFLSEDRVIDRRLFSNPEDVDRVEDRIEVLCQNSGIYIDRVEEICFQALLTLVAAEDLEIEEGSRENLMMRRLFATDGALIAIRRGFFILPPGCTYRLR